MSEPLSPIEIERQLDKCRRALEDCTDDLKASSYAAAKAKHAYRQAFAKKMLLARQEKHLTSDKMREAWAVCETSDEMWERDVAEANHDAQKSVFFSLQEQSGILRTLARSSRDLVDSWGTKP